MQTAEKFNNWRYSDNETDVKKAEEMRQKGIEAYNKGAEIAKQYGINPETMPSFQTLYQGLEMNNQTPAVGREAGKQNIQIRRQGNDFFIKEGANPEQPITLDAFKRMGLNEKLVQDGQTVSWAQASGEAPLPQQGTPEYQQTFGGSTGTAGRTGGFLGGAVTGVNAGLNAGIAGATGQTAGQTYNAPSPTGTVQPAGGSSGPGSTTPAGVPESLANLPPEYQDLYLQLKGQLDQLKQRGQVINPNIEITPEKIAEFTKQAEAEIDPYYALCSPICLNCLP